MMSAQVLPLWPLSGEAMAFDRREIRIGPQEAEATRAPEPSPPHSLIHRLGAGRAGELPARARAEPAL